MPSVSAPLNVRPMCIYDTYNIPTYRINIYIIIYKGEMQRERERKQKISTSIMVCVETVATAAAVVVAKNKSLWPPCVSFLAPQTHSISFVIGMQIETMPPPRRQAKRYTHTHTHNLRTYTHYTYHIYT